MELTPEQVVLDDLQVQIVEREQMLGQLKAEQRALKRELAHERTVGAALREGDFSSGGESPKQSPRTMTRQSSSDTGAGHAAQRASGLGGQHPAARDEGAAAPKEAANGAVGQAAMRRELGGL